MKELFAEPMQLIRHDHDRMRMLFDQIEQATGQDKQAACEALFDLIEIHDEWENQGFYPQVRSKINMSSDLDEWIEEHHLLNSNVQDLRKIQVSDAHFKGKFNALKELTFDHLKEEEDKLFPAVQRADLDFGQLAQEMAQKRQAVEQQFRQATQHTAPASSRHS